MSNATNKSTRTQNAPATGLSAKAKELVTAASAASHASDTAREVQTRANVKVAHQLKRDKVHSSYLGAPFAKENPELTFRTDAMHAVVAGKPAVWAQYYFAFEDKDKKAKLDKGDSTRVLVGVDNDGNDLYKSEYDAAVHFRQQVNSTLGAIAKRLRILEGGDNSTGSQTQKETHMKYLRTILQHIHDAETVPSGYTAEDLGRAKSMLETAYKIIAGKPWEPKKK